MLREVHLLAETIQAESPVSVKQKPPASMECGRGWSAVFTSAISAASFLPNNEQS